MCAKVTEVEHALDDVRELLSQNTRKDPNDRGWEREWVQIVQDVVEKDAGWKCVGPVTPQLLMLIHNASFRRIGQLDNLLEDDTARSRNDSSSVQHCVGMGGTYPPLPV